MTTRALLALAAAFTLTACGGSDGPTGNDPGNDPDNVGTFTGTVAGDISKSITGQAAFGTSVAEGGFALVLGTEDDGFIFARETAGLLAAGQHAVHDLVNEEGDPPANALQGVFGFAANGTEWLCISSGGTVSVANASAARLQGSVNVTATCVAAANGTEKNITVTGQFTAVGGQVD